MNMYEVPGISEDLLERARMYNYMIEGGLYPMNPDHEVVELAKKLWVEQREKDREKRLNLKAQPFRATLKHI